MTAHPLEPLSADEITRAVSILHPEGLVARVVLDEPTKAELNNGAPERRAAITVVPGPGVGVREAIVSLTNDKVVSVDDVPEVRPALLFEDSINAIVAVMENEEFKAAMARRGIDDMSEEHNSILAEGVTGAHCERMFGTMPGSLGCARATRRPLPRSKQPAALLGAGPSVVYATNSGYNPEC